MAFDQGKYNRRVIDLREKRDPRGNGVDASDLVFGEELFLLALEMKLSESPPVSLNEDEICGGLDGAYFSESPGGRERTLRECVDRLQLVLPHFDVLELPSREEIERLGRSWAQHYLNRIEGILGLVVLIALEAKEQLSPEFRAQIAHVLSRKCEDFGRNGYSGPEPEELKGWRECAMQPGMFDWWMAKLAAEELLRG